MINEMNNNDLLKYAVENGIINLSNIQEQIDMKQRKEYLEKHPYDIWRGKDGKWYTYIKDEILKSKRRLIKRSNEKDLQDYLYNFYKEKIDNPTFKAIFDHWISDKIKYNEISQQTYDKYQTDFKRFFTKEIQEKKIGTFNQNDLEEFIKTSIVEKQLTAKAYANMRTLILGAFKYAYRRQYTEFNIVSFFQNIDISKRSFSKKTKNKEKEVFSEKEMKMMSDYIQDHPSIRNLGILLDMYTGLRVGELAALKRKDINIQQRWIHIVRTEIKYKDKNGKCVIDVRDYPKSEAGDRYLLLSDKAVKVLKDIIQINPFGEYLFMDNFKRISVNGFSHKIRRICEALGIEIRSMHKIRKTYGTTLLNANADEIFIKEQMGHSDIKTTRQFYYYSNKDKPQRLEQLNEAMYY